MYRRIELIGKWLNEFESEEVKTEWFKTGLAGYYGDDTLEIFNAWAYQLHAPRHVPRNCRFYFTEEGWKEVGSKVIDACKRTGQEFRIITIKEKSVDVVAKAPLQVAVRPRKKKR